MSVHMDARKVGHRGEMMTVGLGAGTNDHKASALEVQITMQTIIAGYAKAG